MVKNLKLRLSGKYRRSVAAAFFRRAIIMKNKEAFISFSFDDAPQSAFRKGAEILRSNGVRGTYYVSIGLLNQPSPSGRIGNPQDLLSAAEQGFELACHTFDHCDSWKTSVNDIESSILRNQEELNTILPKYRFKSFAYPLSEPNLSIKRWLNGRFLCCRSGGQNFNSKRMDLNLVKAYFLDYRNKNKLNLIEELIKNNFISNGWLVFATHDVDDNPSRFGVSTELFKLVVDLAVKSGSVILPVSEACERIFSSSVQVKNC